MSAAPGGPELRDIHLPPPPSWWPPAPGWWILAALAAVAIVLVARWCLRRRREQRWRRRVHAELARIGATHATNAEPAFLAGEVSQLLRRVAMLAEPAAATLRDEDWLAFLDRRLPPARAAAEPFRTGAGRMLVDAPYRRAGDPLLHTFDADALLDLARAWLDASLAGQRERA